MTKMICTTADCSIWRVERKLVATAYGSILGVVGLPATSS